MYRGTPYKGPHYMGHFPITILYLVTYKEQYMYSQTSEQRTLWDLYKLKCFVFCREVVLFSEVQNVLEL